MALRAGVIEYGSKKMSGEKRDNVIMENGVIVTCPKCGSTNVAPVEPFDYIKACGDCGKEFMSAEHN